MKLSELTKYEVRIDCEPLFQKYSGHFFSPDTMRFFRSRISDAFRLPFVDGIVFLTSEKKCFEDPTRVWTIRKLHQTDHGITVSTLSEFGEYETKAQARSAIVRELCQ